MQKNIMLVSIVAIIAIIFLVFISYKETPTKVDLYGKSIESLEDMEKCSAKKCDPDEKDCLKSCSEEITDLNQKVNDLFKKTIDLSYDSTEREKSREDLINALGLRKKALTNLFEDKPKEAYNLLFSEQFRKDLLKDPSLSDYVEQSLSVSGTLLVVNLDDFDNKKTSTSYHIKNKENPNDIKKLHFLDKTPELQTGSEINGEGTVLGQMVILAAPGGKGGGTTVTPVQLTPNSLGERKTAVMLVNYFSDPTEPLTKSQAADMVFNSLISTNSYFKEVSFNKMYMTGEVYGWYTIDSASMKVCDDLGGLTNAVDPLAIADGVDLTKYNHKVYLLISRDPKCGGLLGLSTLGGSPSISVIWDADGSEDINDGSENSGIRGPNGMIPVITHEFGHALGMHHSNYLYCGDTVPVSKQGCYSEEYGDAWDVMGDFNWAFHDNAPQKISMQWIPKTNIQHIANSGTYTIYSPIETTSPLNQVLKLTRSNVRLNYYYLNFRKQIGFDSGIPSHLDSGVEVHIWNDRVGQKTNLIDASPGSDGRYLIAYLSIIPLKCIITEKPFVFNYECVKDNFKTTLADGQSFEDRENGISVKQLSHDTNSVTLSITLTQVNTPDCTRNNPSITVSPLSQKGTAGSARSYAVTFTNNDGYYCPATDFILSTDLPSSWNVKFEPEILTLWPTGLSDKVGKSTLTVTPPSTQSAGTYNFLITGLDGRANNRKASVQASFQITRR